MVFGVDSGSRSVEKNNDKGVEGVELTEWS